jgi:hypothetical protein
MARHFNQPLLLAHKLPVLESAGRHQADQIVQISVEVVVPLVHLNHSLIYVIVSPWPPPSIPQHK